VTHRGSKDDVLLYEVMVEIHLGGRPIDRELKPKFAQQELVIRAHCIEVSSPLSAPEADDPPFTHLQQLSL
jgi:hypothetical protein